MVEKLAIFSPKIAKNGNYAPIGATWGETLSRHVIGFDQMGARQNLANSRQCSK